MIQSQIYKKEINRPLNPAVSVTDNRENTIAVEIEEYVFTDEIINGLFNVLNAVRKKSANHNGIWISGYYGSGKSHFLKYLNFCLDPKFCEKALARLCEAVDEFDPLRKPDSKSNVQPAEMRDLANWLKGAKVHTVLFNIGNTIGDNVEYNSTFVKAIWKEFNVFRGYNRFNIPMAQYLEKALDRKDKFEAFKQAIEEEGFDWNEDAEALANTELDLVMEAAKAVAPELSVDVIRTRIAENNPNLSVESFCKEVKDYLKGKDEKYRLIFFIDEVSQFIGGRKELLLQLQQIVTTINEASDGRVWVGCTAQQDLSELLTNCQIQESADDYGKIMGRFEKKVALQGTNTEYITQKRILAKDEDAEVELGKLYESKKDAIAAQFKLPTGFRTYKDKQEFIDFYPFVPYQFQLIMRVFDAFVKLEYVDTEVKGNERSVLKITHKTAQNSAAEEVGKFISFDQFFSSMFEAGLKNAGQKAIRNANEIIKEYDEKDFGQRVLRVLFMLCNLDPVNQKVFPATVDNIVTLLMTNVDENKLALKTKTEKALEFLTAKSVIRVQKTEGMPDVYFFLSEDESEVDRLIKTQKADNNKMAEELRTIFAKHFNAVNNKVTFNGNSFSLGWTILGRNSFTQSNPDLMVEFMIDQTGAIPAQIAFQNEHKKMIVLVCEEYANNKRLANDFYWYCQVQTYLKLGASTEQREKTNKEFAKRAQDLYEKSIVPGFKAILDKSPIICGQNLLSAGMLGSKTGAERYNEALKIHFNQLYSMSSLVCGPEFPKSIDELKLKIKRSIDPNEYLIKPMSEAENAVENKLNRLGRDYELGDLLDDFKQSPYGWNEVATVYVVNELVRRHIRAYRYKGDPNIDRNKIAEVIMKDRASFVITSAQKIDPALIEDFITSWKDIFGKVSSSYSHDSSELFHQCRESEDSLLNKAIANYKTEAMELVLAHASGVAKVLEDAVEVMDKKWHAERDPEKFFKLIIADCAMGKDMVDKCKKAIDFNRGPKATFKEVYDFVVTSKDDFDFLDRKFTEDITFIKGILTDEWPVDSIPAYNKRKNMLAAELDAVRKNLRTQIEAAYTDAFQKLQNFETEKGVTPSILPSIYSQVNPAVTTTNIAKLKLSLNGIDSFVSYWTEKILVKAEPEPEDKGGSGDDQDKPKPTKKVRKISAKSICKTPVTIKTQADVDAYIASVKASLEAQLDNNDEVIIL